MKSIYFFGLKEDLLQVFSLVEASVDLKYMLIGNFKRDQMSENTRVFHAGAELPNLGKATAGQWNACDSFLVCELGLQVNLRSIQTIDGYRVCVDQLVNPDTVVFTSGGRWDENVVINGSVGTATDSKVSQRIMKCFQSAIKNSFVKIQAFYVGPEAIKLFELGKRFAGAVQSPREYDLSRNVS